ncbi:MAG TPA: DUF4189 domain-containing protein [Longimicrobium sp.]|jgi:hypothetical protein|uniref:DUF4189 domain-containing protein n=1 Tax=Longimicrobium sp. TaxID=2029185 RepID=UPI002EDACD3E
MRLPLVVLALLVLATVVLVAVLGRESNESAALPPASSETPADTLVGTLPATAATVDTAGEECDAARDQRVLEVVDSEIRGALAGRATPGEIDARVVAAHERLRTSAALSCSAAIQLAATTEGQFGAIAVGPDGAWGVSWDHPSQADADSNALQECLNCRVVVRVIGPTCGAYASNGLGSGWAVGATREVAKTNSYVECSASGPGCSVVAYACNSRLADSGAP